MMKTFEQLSIQISDELHDNLHIYCEFLSDEDQNDMSLVAANFFQAGVYNTKCCRYIGGMCSECTECQTQHHLIHGRKIQSKFL